MRCTDVILKYLREHGGTASMYDIIHFVGQWFSKGHIHDRISWLVMSGQLTKNERQRTVTIATL